MSAINPWGRWLCREGGICLLWGISMKLKLIVPNRHVTRLKGHKPLQIQLPSSSTWIFWAEESPPAQNLKWKNHLLKKSNSKQEALKKSTSLKQSHLCYIRLGVESRAFKNVSDQSYSSLLLPCIKSLLAPCKMNWWSQPSSHHTQGTHHHRKKSQLKPVIQWRRWLEVRVEACFVLSAWAVPLPQRDSAGGGSHVCLGIFQQREIQSVFSKWTLAH